MKTLKKITGFLFLFLPVLLLAETTEIPFTLEDRDRIIRTERKVGSVNSEMNARFEAVDKQFKDLRSEMDARFGAIDKRFDQLFSFLRAFIGIFTAMMASVFGFAFWDRKLSLAPLKNENAKTLNALGDYAEHQPKLKEILKKAGLL